VTIRQEYIEVSWLAPGHQDHGHSVSHHCIDDLHRDDAWTEEGIVIGEPDIRISPNDPERKSEPALWNPIQLSPSQTKAVLRLLERNEARLRGISEKEEEERSRALGRAYRYVLGLTAQKKSEPNDDGASQHLGVSE
jgi:hypothetical protein